MGVFELLPVDETLARAIASCRVPVVTAIGHETDRSLADDVADLRVGTPSMAAERTIPERRHLATALVQLRQRALHAVEGRLRGARSKLQAARSAVARVASTKFQRHRDRLARSREALSRQAGARLHRTKSRLGSRRTELNRLMSNRLGCERARIERLTAELAALDPTAVLSRGYAILSDERGQVVSSVAEARRAGRLSIRVRDGDLLVQVSEAI
jgi:exodeoxyribonuclease VII large subunit